jgi:hypothetical protein
MNCPGFNRGLLRPAPGTFSTGSYLAIQYAISDCVKRSMAFEELLWRSARSQNFFTCNFTCKVSGLAVLPRTQAIPDVF